jgi:hypothetical protein
VEFSANRTASCQQQHEYEHENVRLKEALIKEKKRMNRGETLLLEAEEEYHGGAVFWSLRKMLDARDRQH